VTPVRPLPIPAAGARRRRPGRLHRAVLDWYADHGRSLAFRSTREPWPILVSEVMLQQTQADRVAPAWQRFVRRYPTAAVLAAATPADALRAWSGLGYNRRAVALWRAAVSIVERHGGDVPDDVAALEQLPGVGPYTARAVAAIAFGRTVGAVDVNIRRVLDRLAGPDEDRPAQVAVQPLADALVPAGSTADWTHALMDIGAMICRPREPRCPACPVRPWCRTAASGAPRRVPPRPAMQPPFESTSRWLRGRIVHRLTLAPDGGWTTIEGPIGGHDRDAVATALVGLERDGLLERASDGAVRLPSQPAAAG
jgi:A/G-specific adenine glycosylase